MLFALLAGLGVVLLAVGIYLPRTGKDVIAERLAAFNQRPRSLEEMELQQPFTERVLRPFIRQLADALGLCGIHVAHGCYSRAGDRQVFSYVGRAAATHSDDRHIYFFISAHHRQGQSATYKEGSAFHHFLPIYQNTIGNGLRYARIFLGRIAH